MAKRKPESFRITRIELENWRNFAQASVALQRRVFLVGPNASGKSNFLDVFRFLHDIVSVGGGLQEAIRRRGGVSRLRCLAARRYPDIRVAVDIGTDEQPRDWQYEIVINQDKQRQVFIRCERVKHGERLILARPEPADEEDSQRLMQTHLEQVLANKEFRDVAKALRAIRYLHIVPQLVREPDRSIGRSNDPYGGDFLEQVATTPSKTRDSRLRRISDALRVAVPQLRELELHRDDRGTPHVRGRYEHWRPQGAWQSEEDFSDGTLRLMGLLWAVLDGVGPLLLEEPELSLHPEVVRCLPQMFARIQRHTGRQILVSTHSSDLLQDSGIGLDEVLLLQPGSEGTTVSVASAFTEIPALLEGGITLADAVIPRTRPGRVEQLSLFGD